ncbi:MAG TPA: RagB/SusD family nutrient uptake outer membrane protein [Gemmatimonadaceae bacterium]|nr:RagB/SusD family nutrient uptake outer membrane protein [Gemmatimonadaceae bacterium]
MNKLRFATVAGGAAVLALAAACNPDLNVTNPNQPDVARAISSGSDVRQLIGSSYNTMYLAMQGCAVAPCEPNPGIATAVMADVFTMAFGNFGARFNGQEPRLAYNNSSAATDGRVSSQPYDAVYGALGAANDGLRAIKNNVRVAPTPSSADETPQMQAFAWLVQGMALGFESQIWDKGFVVTEDSEGTAVLVDYKAMRDASIVSLNKAIAAATGKSWTISQDFTSKDLNLTAPNFVKMANTIAARVIAYNARNATENAATDWAKVLTYANAGISTGTAPFNLSAFGDGGFTWYDEMKGYGDLADGSWVRVDQRIIQEAATNAQPTIWTSTTPPPFPVIPDLRFSHGTPNAAGNIEQAGADFWFEKAVPYAVARGLYFWSQWAHARYIDASYYNDNTQLGPAPYVLQAENDLLIAEALIRTNGDKARAATLINKTRVGRGGLPAVTAATSNNELLGAIFYERDVELFDSGAAQGWFDRRRIDPTVTYNGLAIGNIWAFQGGTNLQKGTPRHLPLPAKELETLGLPVYTYGGASPNPVFPEM